jgi:hypothetical protein
VLHSPPKAAEQAAVAVLQTAHRTLELHPAPATTTPNSQVVQQVTFWQQMTVQPLARNEKFSLPRKELPINIYLYFY